MNHRQTGFTLIELIMVIIILGVLAAVAIPKFTNLSADANAAAVQSVAGSLSSAAATNYAIRSAKSTNGVAVANCDGAKATLQGGALPTGAGGTYSIYSVTDGDGGTTAIAAGTTATCTLKFAPSAGTAVTATFTVTGIA
jgi:MSHA pilin protein MshA